jgi:hypothetical protein
VVVWSVIITKKLKVKFKVMVGDKKEKRGEN